ncbi:hypothetical protein Q7P37_004623 [Cladosporium fusiforme]
MTSVDRIRLHITPFNASIYDRVVSSSAKATATGISYHTTQTQPDLGFGYIELPKTEADKLKKKLHGSTLKGSKMRVEEAKPEKKRKAERDETEEERKERKKARKAKKAKREEGVLPGYELEEGRHVKRGWSEGTDKKSKKMRFKTSVPPNAMPLEDSDDDKKKKKSKDKKAKREAEKDGDEKAKKSHRKTPKVVEEFSKKKGVMISAEGESKGALEYVEGQGWVNEAGEVVEAEPLSVRRERAKQRATEELRQAEARKAQQEQAQEELRQAEAMAVDANEDADSAASASADEDMADSDEDDVSEVASSAEDHSQEEAAASGAARAPPAAKLVTPVPESEREIHPLEALYKRAPQQAEEESSAKHALPPINTSFSFFNADDISDSEEPAAGTEPARAPQTPHTKQDLEWRALRSAAPTPDTAGLGKRFRFAMGGAEDGDEDSDEEMGDDDAAAPAVGQTERGDESEFRKWFYEHRGENNRAWKKKRKEAKKQQRQRENRRVSRRVV